MKKYEPHPPAYSRLKALDDQAAEIRGLALREMADVREVVEVVDGVRGLDRFAYPVANRLAFALGVNLNL